MVSTSNLDQPFDVRSRHANPASVRQRGAALSVSHAASAFEPGVQVPGDHERVRAEPVVGHDLARDRREELVETSLVDER